MLWEDIYTIGHYGIQGLTMMKCSTLKWQQDWQFGSNSFVSCNQRHSEKEYSCITESILSAAYFAKWKDPKEKLVSSVASLFKTSCSLLSYCAPKKKCYFNYVFGRISKNASKFTCPIIHCRFRKFG